MARTPTHELEGAILAAADAELADVGPAALTLRSVAKRAGVSPQSIYNRFADKHALLDEVCHLGFVRLRAHLLDAEGSPLSAITDPVANLAEGLRRYRGFAVEQPHHYGVMFDAPIPDFSISDRTIGTAFESLRVLIDAVADAVDLGALAPIDPLVGAQRIWAAAHGVLRFERHDVGFVEDWAIHYDATVATMLRGLAPQTD